MNEEGPITQRSGDGGPSIGTPRLGAGGALLALAVGMIAALTAVLALSMATSSFAILTVAGEVALMMGVVGYLAARRVGVSRVLRLDAVPRRVYWPAIKLGVALLVANAAAAILVGPPTRELQLMAEADTLVERIALAGGVVVAAPLIEEALFRGLIQRLLEQRVHHWLAIGLTAVAFGALHGVESGLILSFWALPLGWITWRSGSIRPAVVVHALNNLVGFALLLDAGADPVPPEVTSRETIIAAAALALMAVWVVRSCRQFGGRLDDEAGASEAKPGEHGFRT